MKKGQTWSLDVLIAVGVFVLAITIFFYVINLSSEAKKIEELRREANIIPKKISSSFAGTNESIVFVIDSKIDTDKLIDVTNMNYEQLKAELGIKNDVCIYFEDKEGNLINISLITGSKSIGLGNGNASVNGMPCGLPS